MKQGNGEATKTEIYGDGGKVWQDGIQSVRGRGGRDGGGSGNL